MALKKLYSWSEKLYQFITNLFFLANIPTPGRVYYHVEKNLTPSCLRSSSTGVTERYLPLHYYTCTEIHDEKTRKKSAVSWNRRNMHNFSSVCFLSFKIKQKDLIVQKSKKVKGASLQFAGISLLTSDPVDSFVEVSKIIGRL